MLSVELAARLRDAGLRWRPAPGDRFVIPQPDLTGQLFTLSEMTIEAHEHPSGTVLGFNGTTEWALDSVAQDDALWVPREDQLRELLGATFVRLEVAPGGAEDAADDGDDPAADGTTGPLDETAFETGAGPFAVTTRAGDGSRRTFHGATAADAYARALLVLVRRAVGAAGT